MHKRSRTRIWSKIIQLHQVFFPRRKYPKREQDHKRNVFSCTQCVQIFLPPKAQKKSKKRKKKRQPKMSKILLHFWTFQGWFTFQHFFPFEYFFKIFKFHYIKIPKTQKAPLFAVFALRAICKNRGAKKGQKAPLLREIARSGHTVLNPEGLFLRGGMKSRVIDIAPRFRAPPSRPPVTDEVIRRIRLISFLRCCWSEVV